MSIKIKRILSFVAVLVWMVVIFLFSAENSKESSKTSDGVVAFIASITVDGFDEMTDEQKAEVIDSMSAFVRTAAHFCSFALLGFLSLNALLTFETKLQFKALYAWLFSVFYAFTDELHQYFVPGRACDIMDIAVDSTGALTGVLAMLLLITLIKYFKTKKNKKYNIPENP